MRKLPRILLSVAFWATNMEIWINLHSYDARRFCVTLVIVYRNEFIRTVVEINIISIFPSPWKK